MSAMKAVQFHNYNGPEALVYEDAPRPGGTNRSATLLTSEAQGGVFRFVGTDGAQHTVNVLQLAGTAGYQNSIDPTVSGVLGVINDPYGLKMNNTQNVTNAYLAQALSDPYVAPYLTP